MKPLQNVCFFFKSCSIVYKSGLEPHYFSFPEPEPHQNDAVLQLNL
jgi:hypothetical protein